MLFVLSYIYMYMVILDNESYAAKIGVEASILFIFWADCVCLLYFKAYDRIL